MSENSHAKWLRTASKEISSAGHAGWGNTCSFAADEIDRLETAIAAANQLAEARLAEVGALKHDIDRLFAADQEHLNDLLAAERALAGAVEDAGDARREAFEDAAQVARYYLKHQNFSCIDINDYEEGVTHACENIDKILRDKADATTRAAIDAAKSE